MAAQMMCAEMAEVPWGSTWWSQVLRFLRQLVDMPCNGLHARILQENVHDALADLLCGNWAAGIQKKYVSLGVRSPFSAVSVQAIEAPLFRQKMCDDDKSQCANLHVSPPAAPAAGAKLCTFLR